MKRLVLLAMLMVSTNGFAATATHHLSSAVTKGMNSHTGVNHVVKLYGGKDFSRSLMANANESVWNGQPTFTG